MIRPPYQFPDDFRVDEGVFVPNPSRSEWSYSDGDEVERHLLDLISSSTDISCLSMELRAKISNWPTLYHLSPRRGNLLRPLAPFLRGKILEVGAGCGAITRFLGENGASVTAVEGSFRRATIARERTRDLENVTVVNSPVEEILFEEKFDAVTLIGVLEYARVFGQGANPMRDLLEHLRPLLKPDGLLIVAIENQLGLKYFAGGKEDHTNLPFFGINDLYSERSAVTFGKGELNDVLAKSGFLSTEWLYPFPDYKLPTTIINDQAVHHQNGKYIGQLIATSNTNDPQRPVQPSFSLEQSWRVLARNGLVGELANSFLILCRQSLPTERAINPSCMDNVLAWHYSVDRHPAYAKETVFSNGDENAIRLERTRMTITEAPPGPLIFNLEDEDFIPGKIWWFELVEILNRPDWSVGTVSAWIRVWIDALMSQANLTATGPLHSVAIPGKYLDAMPFNMIEVSQGQYHFFDLEWAREERLQLDALTYRALFESLKRVTSCARPAKLKHLSINLLIKDVFANLNIPIDDRKIQAFREAEQALQSMASFGVDRARKPERWKLYNHFLSIRSIKQPSLARRAFRRGKSLFLRG